MSTMTRNEQDEQAQEVQTTVGFIAIALVTAGLAWLATPNPSPSFDQSEFGVGEYFFPELNKDVTQVQGLEVVAYNEETGAVRSFKVQSKNGTWVIPSHDDYPADAVEQIGKVSGSLFDLKKNQFVSARKTDFETFGVLDPTDDGNTDKLTGLGTRVNLLDASGGVLASFIFGERVPNKDGYRYVRVPEKSQVYAAVVQNVDISTRFSDWIETDLLQLDAADFKEVEVYNYEIDAARGTFKERERFTLEKDSGDWTMDGLAPTEQLAQAKVSDLERALDELVITGVNPKPETLRRVMEGKSNELARDDLISLQERGFYLTQGTIVSNVGEVLVTSKKGVLIRLWFGELAADDKSDISGGSLKGEGEEPGEEESESAGQRYLLIQARLAEEFAEPPAEPVVEGMEDEAKKAAQDAHAKAVAEFESRKADASKVVTELNERFAEWYYLIDDNKFQKIRASRADLVEAKPAGETDAPGGMVPERNPGPGIDINPFETGGGEGD